MDFAQAILGIMTALAGLLAAVAAAVRISTQRWEKSDQERRRLSDELIKELRHDITTERNDNQALRQRVKDLEESRVKDQRALDELQGQLKTVLSEMASLQGQIKALESKLEKAEKENGQLRTENEHLRSDLDEARRKLAVAEQAVTNYRDALRLVGARAETQEPGESTAPVPEPSEIKSEEKSS